MRLLLALLAVLLAAPALARDDGRWAGSPLHDWFNGLSSGKGLCCSSADGIRIENVDWGTEDGRYQVRICKSIEPGETWESCAHKDWFIVPDDAVVTEPNRFGPAVVWPYEMGGMIRIRCFIPGAQT